MSPPPGSGSEFAKIGASPSGSTSLTDGRDPGIERHEHDVGNSDEVEPRRVDAAVRRKKRLELIRQGDAAAAVDCEVVASIASGQRGAELLMTVDADRDARQRLAVAAEHASAQHDDAVWIDRSRCHRRLDRVLARVEELGNGDGGSAPPANR